MLAERRRNLSKKKSAMILYGSLVPDFARTLYCYLIAKFRNENLIIISLYEHIGDIISCEPVIKYIKETRKPCFIVWALNKSYKELLKTHPDVDYIFPLNYFSEWIMLKKFLLLLLQPSQIIDLHINGKRCSKFKRILVKKDNGVNIENFLKEKNLLQSFSRLAGLTELNSAPGFFIDKRMQEYELHGKYVVFHTNSNSLWKNWRQNHWERLCREINSMGYYAVEIGVKKEIQEGGNKYIDYTGKKSLQAIANMILNASLFIGLDSGFSHMANALNVDGLILLGQYTINGTIIYKYNPFSGNYALSPFIIYAENKAVKELEYSKVIKRIRDKLISVHSTSAKIV